MSVSDLLAVEGRVGQIATYEASSRELISMLIALSIHRYGENQEAKTLIKAIRQADNLRNQIVHSLWIQFDDDEINRTKWSLNNSGVNQVDEQYTVEDLNAIAIWFYELAEGIRSFYLEKSL